MCTFSYAIRAVTAATTTAPPFRCAFQAKHTHCHDRSVSLFHSHSHYRALNTAVNSINYDILCFSLALCVYVLNLSHLSICNLERKLEKKYVENENIHMLAHMHGYKKKKK